MVLEIPPGFYFYKFAKVLQIFLSWGPDLYVDHYLLQPFIIWSAGSKYELSFPSPGNRTCNGSSGSQKLKEAEPANHRTSATRPCPSDVLQSWQTNLYHIRLATCSIRSFWQGSFTVKKKSVSFSAEHTEALSVGLITRRKEIFKSKTRRLLYTYLWEKRFYSEYGREMERE